MARQSLNCWNANYLTASPAQPSPAQPSPARPGPAQPSPAQPSPAQPKTVFYSFCSFILFFLIRSFIVLFLTHFCYFFDPSPQQNMAVQSQGQCVLHARQEAHAHQCLCEEEAVECTWRCFWPCCRPADGTGCQWNLGPPSSVFVTECSRLPVPGCFGPTSKEMVFSAIRDIASLLEKHPDPAACQNIEMVVRPMGMCVVDGVVS